MFKKMMFLSILFIFFQGQQVFAGTASHNVEKVLEGEGVDPGVSTAPAPSSESVYGMAFISGTGGSSMNTEQSIATGITGGNPTTMSPVLCCCETNTYTAEAWVPALPNSSSYCGPTAHVSPTCGTQTMIYKTSYSLEEAYNDAVAENPGANIQINPSTSVCSTSTIP